MFLYKGCQLISVKCGVSQLSQLTQEQVMKCAEVTEKPPEASCLTAEMVAKAKKPHMITQNVSIHFR